MTLAQKPRKGSCVVYVMSRDQRVDDNFALLLAQREALERRLPLVVLFVLRDRPGGRSREHFLFMLDGLEEVSRRLQELGIAWVLRQGSPSRTTLATLRELDAASVYLDFSPLRGARARAELLAREFEGSTHVVDAHNVIPAWEVSDKQEVAAHTMRSKVHKLLGRYLEAPPRIVHHPYSLADHPETLSFEQARDIVHGLPACGIRIAHPPGEKAARRHLQEFIDEKLEHYALLRNDVGRDFQSDLSPWLHLGQISSLRVALQVIEAVGRPPLLLERAKLAEHSGQPSAYDGMNALLEEVIVRKELSDNFCLHNPHYKSLQGAPEWGRQTLEAHREDPREFTYSLQEWEEARTHDRAWNAAQTQLRRVGKIHGYMRMYWAKKMLEWSRSPEEAVEMCVYLNDKYSVDGGDPNGYAGILWSIGGLHDHPWKERPVFGKIRYMSAEGIRRKYDLDSYCKRWLGS